MLDLEDDFFVCTMNDMCRNRINDTNIYPHLKRSDVDVIFGHSELKSENYLLVKIGSGRTYEVSVFDRNLSNSEVVDVLLKMANETVGKIHAV